MAGPLARGAGRSAFEVERAWATTGGDLMAGWDRIEAIARSTGLTGGLEARVANPLWLLARQWQVGEFHGDDAAQPAVVRITGRSTPLATFRAGRGARPVPIPVATRWRPLPKRPP